MTFPYSKENAESYQRLKSLAQRLTDTDLDLSTEYGWTVAALLAHLAFWDQRVLVILRRWKEDGFDPSPIDSTAVNDSLKVICHALNPHSAVDLCLVSAEAVDAELEMLSPNLVRQMEKHAQSTDTQFRMNRSLHRNGHLNDIDTLLAK